MFNETETLFSLKVRYEDYYSEQVICIIQIKITYGINYVCPTA